MIYFPCPACGVEIEMPEDGAREDACCQFCGEKLRVPEKSAAHPSPVELPSNPGAEVRMSLKCPKCSLQFDHGLGNGAAPAYCPRCWETLASAIEASLAAEIPAPSVSVTQASRPQAEGPAGSVGGVTVSPPAGGRAAVATDEASHQASESDRPEPRRNTPAPSPTARTTPRTKGEEETSPRRPPKVDQPTTKQICIAASCVIATIVAIIMIAQSQEPIFWFDKHPIPTNLSSTESSVGSVVGWVLWQQEHGRDESDQWVGHHQRLLDIKDWTILSVRTVPWTYSDDKMDHGTVLTRIQSGKPAAWAEWEFKLACQRGDWRWKVVSVNRK
jgi:hypothetical protein